MSYFKLLLSECAHRQIVSDCLDHATTEIGGVLPGRYDRGAFVVPFSIPAGPAAHCTPSRFTPDEGWQQVLLNFLHARFGVDYLGDWHRHPGSFDEPSDHDLRTAREIVTSAAWNKPVAIFPIAVIEEGTVRMRAYLMSRKTLKFEEVPISIVPDSDLAMTAVLTGMEAVPAKEAAHGDVQSLPTGRVRKRASGSTYLRRLKAGLGLRPRARRNHPSA